MDEIAIKYRIKTIKKFNDVLSNNLTEMPQSVELLKEWIDELYDMIWGEDKF